MPLNKILWISSKLSSNNRTISPFWVLCSGIFKVNIIHNKASNEELTKTIAAVRTIRVGNEARYPMITIYTTMERAKQGLIEEICRSDTSTPRIRLMIVVNRVTYDKGKLDSIILLSKANYLDTKVLFILDGELFNSVKIINNNCNTTNIFYEWFPTMEEQEDNFKYHEVIEWLDDIEYDYSRHPLYLCGIISLLSRELLISKYVVEYKKHDSNQKSSQNIINYLNMFSHASPNCSLGAMAELFTDKAYTELHVCSGTANLELPLDIRKLVTKKSTTDLKDFRLFEDWQYIYDGFEHV